MNHPSVRGERLSVADRSPPKQLLLSWSSGKDSAWALHALRGDSRVEVNGLFTTVNERYDRVAIHGVREALLEAQARSIGLPLTTVPLPHPCSNAVYEEHVAAALAEAKARGITGIAFGDLFLEDIREYRERQCSDLGLEAHFPLWGMDTRALAHEMIERGTRAVITCVDPRQCPREFAGRRFDHDLLHGLPGTVDPCGENGEFHTFALDGPAFGAAIPVELGEVVERGGVVFADLRPA